MDKFGDVRADPRPYMTERDWRVFDYVVKPSGSHLSFITTAFSNQSGYLGKVFGVWLIRALAALSKLAFVVQNQTVSESGKPSSLLDCCLGHYKRGTRC